SSGRRMRPLTSSQRSSPSVDSSSRSGRAADAISAPRAASSSSRVSDARPARRWQPPSTKTCTEPLPSKTVMTRAFVCGLVLLASTTLLAQTADQKLEFEVASVKPFSITQAGAPVTLGARIDGAQARLVGLTMRDLLAMAYRVKIYQLNGPDWIA